MDDGATGNRSRSRDWRSPRGAIAALVVAVSLACIAVITLTPAASSVQLPFWCMRCGLRPALDILLNVLMFMPLGIGLGMTRARARWAVLIVFALTCSIEGLQFAVVPGRFASARDILANTTGGIAGLWIMREWRVFVAPAPARARHLGYAALLLWLGSQLFTTWALVPAIPPSPWWAQISRHDHGYSAYFTGRVVRASLGSAAIRSSDRLEDSERARFEWLRGDPIAVVLTRTSPGVSPAPVFVIAAEASPSEVASIAQRGTGVLFRVRTRAAVIGLRNPAVSLADVFPLGSESDTVTVRVRYLDGRYSIDSRDAHARRELTLAASPSWLWALLMPVRHFALGPGSRWLTAAWLFVALLATGLWRGQGPVAGSEGRRLATARGLAPLIATIVAGLALVPMAFGLQCSHWSEWAAAGAGAVFGVMGGQALRGDRPSSPANLNRPLAAPAADR